MHPVEFQVTFEMHIMTIYNPPVDYIFWSMWTLQLDVSELRPEKHGNNNPVRRSEPLAGRQLWCHRAEGGHARGGVDLGVRLLLNVSGGSYHCFF